MPVVAVKNIRFYGNVRNEADADLATSIQKHGVLVPLELFRFDEDSDTWFIKDGHRRYQGAVVAGLETVPFIEVDPPDGRSDQMVQQFVINQHRKGLSPLEQAQVFYTFQKEFGWAQKAIAHTFGVSEAAVSLSLAALRAVPAIRDAVLEGKLSASAVEPVLSLEPADQEKVAPMVLQARTVRGVAAVVSTYRKQRGIERGIRKPHVERQRSVARNPLEAVALDALETALRNVKLASGTPITEPAAKAEAIDTLTELVKTVEALRDHLYTAADLTTTEDAELSWEELEDLL